MTDTPLPVPSPVFLPLRVRSLARYLAEGSVPEAPLEQAGLLAALLCRGQPQPPAAVQRLLHDGCALFAADDGSAAAAQLAALRGKDTDSVDAWLGELAMQPLLLAPDEVMASALAVSPRAYPGADFQAACQVTLGEHEVHFPATSLAEGDEDAAEAATGDTARATVHSGRFTSEQARVLRAIAANPEELIDLEGYAGTGKGHLVLALMDARPGRYTYVAPSRGQVEAFRARLPADAGARLLTQIEFANVIARHAAGKGLTAGFVPTYRQSTLSLREIAARIGVAGIGARRPDQVLMIALEGIGRWCASSAPALQPWHFQRSLPAALIEAAPFLAAAEQVWRCMFDPAVQKGGCLSLTVGHIGKWLGLRGVPLPVSLGMVLVDEAHDLSPAWKQLLATHGPGVVSLGDPHQRLVGRSMRWSAAKVLEMHQSVRQGSQVDTLVNQSLALDVLDGDSTPFMGASDRATGVRRYRDWAAVPAGHARVYGSLWRLLQEMAQLVARGARVHLHPASRQALLRDVHGPIDAWRSARDGGPAQRWESFAQACTQRGLADVPGLFASGFDAAALERLLAQLVDAAQATVVLCLAQHAKNLQFTTVAMAPCCFDSGHDPRALHSPVRAAYLAMTRASAQLWLPGDAMEQLQRSAQRHGQAQDTRRQQRRQASAPAAPRR
ncbi:hypothetical protein [Stenotrophomonas sp. 24(2023)]|uniref:hypothetical protein n=1 Tax=Stenotrophomonas sp. 24(2023) TaxID=3068324 RepID=UPI0027E0BA63|nr:hypothetical protein [Stenotrophomonas sp. 24(2023)]WMJ71131.1 hypothetical protein Q9R17_08570 [Stenotrophomonas sp. 24(2023)]